MTINNKKLPKRAMNINGSFLEDLIPGYQTLDVEGRELFETTNEYAQLGIRDGERHIYNRIPSRKLVIKYYLKAEDPSSFRDKFNKLNVALFTENEVSIWFNDEPEMIFKGTKASIDEVNSAYYWATGSFTIICGDPYKYTKSDATSVTWGSKTITFQSNYLLGNTGSGAVLMPIVFEGGAYWGSDIITWQHQGYLMGDDGKDVQPYEIYPTVEGLKVKPTIVVEGMGRGIQIRTRKDTIDLGDFDNSIIEVDTQTFNIVKDGKPMIRPMNDFYIYPNEPLYVSGKDGDFELTIKYSNRYL
ncbi:phage tail family protein [Enterococcus hirae]|uniref:distal tail protein Dit n=1 Tax=Enterococcus faecium TaxID=1352 RepID=UPI0003540795|nr:distal tail protein Dit [Enterococcus faecium]EMF0272185.1 phage tail family protein [Enterococcus hirae]DAI24371.1 MAG TPA: Receptor binding protein [Caudoviricetes sp.]EJC3744153.1 phage tail family protein [Enterococcus faecium]EMF0391899.1 phage tail family protein [Enterococcus hirae]EMF0394581.1 phage tail family protein [Enterococcus hirae]